MCDCLIATVLEDCYNTNLHKGHHTLVKERKRRGALQEHLPGKCLLSLGGTSPSLLIAMNKNPISSP